MTRGRFASGTSRRVNLAVILLIYFIVCMVSTTGVDVLMLLTGALMVWATVREFANTALAAVLASVLAIVAQG